MLARNIRIALIEDNISWADKEANLNQLKRNLQNIPDGTDIVVLPEMFSTGVITSSKDDALALAERNTGDTMHLLSELAQQHQVAIAGSFLASTANRIYNRAFFIEPSGDETFYDKRHLFALGGEDKIYSQGLFASPIIRFRGLNIKIIICYDLRFPVFCRNTNNQYDLLIAVANWPKARQNAWQQLLIARAIENQAYVCGVNRTGTDPQGIDYGQESSLIIDFKGKIVAQRSTSPIIASDLSPALLSQFREKFPAWRDADPFTISI